MDEQRLSDIQKECTLKRNCKKYNVEYVGPSESLADRDTMRKAIDRKRKQRERSKGDYYDTKDESDRHKAKLRMQRLRKDETATQKEAR